MNYRQAYAIVRPIVQEYALTNIRQDSSEDMACPACGGILHVQRLGFDGRLAKTAAHCETAFCVQWTE